MFAITSALINLGTKLITYKDVKMDLYFYKTESDDDNLKYIEIITTKHDNSIKKYECNIANPNFVKNFTDYICLRSDDNLKEINIRILCGEKYYKDNKEIYINNLLKVLSLYSLSIESRNKLLLGVSKEKLTFEQEEEVNDSDIKLIQNIVRLKNIIIDLIFDIITKKEVTEDIRKKIQELSICYDNVPEEII